MMRGPVKPVQPARADRMAPVSAQLELWPDSAQWSERAIRLDRLVTDLARMERALDDAWVFRGEDETRD